MLIGESTADYLCFLDRKTSCCSRRNATTDQGHLLLLLRGRSHLQLQVLDEQVLMLLQVEVERVGLNAELRLLDQVIQHGLKLQDVSRVPSRIHQVHSLLKVKEVRDVCREGSRRQCWRSRILVGSRGHLRQPCPATF